MNAPETSIQTIERASAVGHFEVYLALAGSTQSPPPPIAVTVTGRGNGVDMAINQARVATFDRQRLGAWIYTPGPDAISTGPVIWQHTAAGVALDYCGHRHLLSLEAVTALTRLL